MSRVDPTGISPKRSIFPRKTNKRPFLTPDTSNNQIRFTSSAFMSCYNSKWKYIYNILTFKIFRPQKD